MDKTIHSVITESFGMSPVEINTGRCYNWAWIASKILDAKLCTIRELYGHAFILKNNKFYDAEAPNGVDNWWELPYFQNNFGTDEACREGKLRITQEHAFVRYWSENGAYGMYPKVLRKTLKELTRKIVSETETC